MDWFEAFQAFLAYLDIQMAFGTAVGIAQEITNGL